MIISFDRKELTVQITTKFAYHHPYDYQRNTCVFKTTYLSADIAVNSIINVFFFCTYGAQLFFFLKNNLTTQIKWLHRNRTIDIKKKRAVVSNRYFYKHETNPWNIIENNLHSYQDVIFLSILEFSTSLAIFLFCLFYYKFRIIFP